MPIDQLTDIVAAWATLLGAEPEVGAEHTGRELWPVTADDQNRYFLKRLGPWRNLPVADEARILRWLAHHHVDVAEFLITDHATLFAGPPEDSFVLMPQLPAEIMGPTAVLDLEETVGAAVAVLHRTLATYPWPVHSYTEQLAETVLGDLLLPSDVVEAYAGGRAALAAAIDRLPVQLVHGDLTPDNILLRPHGVAGFIDFDHLPVAPRVWDLAKYLSRRLRRRWHHGADAVGTHQPPVDRTAHIGPFVAGYHQVSPLSDVELEALPAVILAGNVIEASYGQQISAGALPRRQLPDHDHVLADTVEAVRWQLSHLDVVEQAVRTAVA